MDLLTSDMFQQGLASLATSLGLSSNNVLAVSGCVLSCAAALLRLYALRNRKANK